MVASVINQRQLGNPVGKQHSVAPKETQYHYYVYRCKPGYKPGEAGILDFLELTWYRFELQSNLYMLDRTEKTVICTLIHELLITLL